MERIIESANGAGAVPELVAGCHIRVLAPANHAGMQGCVLEVNSKGDAKIRFVKGTQWISRSRLDHLEVISLDADLSFDGSCAAEERSSAGLKAASAIEVVSMFSALCLDDYSHRYNFKLVTSDIFKRADPGDDGTNAKYCDLMHEIDRTLSTRYDVDRLYWNANATRAASDKELLTGAVHTEEFIREMKKRTSEAQSRGTKLNKSYLKLMDEISAGWGEETELAARTGVAALIDCAKEVYAGTYANGFVLAKPPSHHAVGNASLARNGSQKDLPFGFCHLNSIASAVANLQYDHPQLRACIFDFDVHPGNGNEDTFWNDPTVMTISIHQSFGSDGFGFGMCLAEHVGGPEALGSVLNLLMLPYSQDADYYHAVNECIIPEIQKFSPEIIFIAAGFDALKDDPYADQELTTDWYGWCLAELMRLDIPMVLNLEGGYDPKESARAIDLCVSSLAGATPSEFSDRMTLGSQRGKHCEHMKKMCDARLKSLRKTSELHNFSETKAKPKKGSR